MYCGTYVNILQVEYGIFKVDSEAKTVKLSLRGAEVRTLYIPYSHLGPSTTPYCAVSHAFLTELSSGVPFVTVSACSVRQYYRIIITAGPRVGLKQSENVG